jgi:hypothetical protein
VFIYQVLFLWLPMPAALALLPTLRAMGEQREPRAAPREAGVTDHGRRHAHLPSQPAPVAAPHRALVLGGRTGLTGHRALSRATATMSHRGGQVRDDVTSSRLARGAGASWCGKRECCGTPRA